MHRLQDELDAKNRELDQMRHEFEQLRHENRELRIAAGDFEKSTSSADFYVYARRQAFRDRLSECSEPQFGNELLDATTASSVPEVQAAFQEAVGALDQLQMKLI